MDQCKKCVFDHEIKGCRYKKDAEENCYYFTEREEQEDECLEK